MLWRLNVTGSWNSWRKNLFSWEHFSWNISKDIKESKVPAISWVARLSSGRPQLEKKGRINIRGLMRSKGIEKLLVGLDERVLRNLYNFEPKERYLK
jgi:hypothetical protein